MTAQTTSEQTAEVAWLVTRFAEEVPGVTRAVVVTTDGLQLAAAGDVDRDLGDQLAALTAGMLSISQQFGQQLDLGVPENMTARYPGGHVAFVRLGQAGGLCVAARPGTDLRALGYAMTQFAAATGHALTPRLRHHGHTAAAPATN